MPAHCVLWPLSSCLESSHRTLCRQYSTNCRESITCHIHGPMGHDGFCGSECILRGHMVHVIRPIWLLGLIYGSWCSLCWDLHNWCDFDSWGYHLHSTMPIPKTAMWQVVPQPIQLVNYLTFKWSIIVSYMPSALGQVLNNLRYNL